LAVLIDVYAVFITEIICRKLQTKAMKATFEKI
jgi:hypothetical protein